MLPGSPPAVAEIPWLKRGHIPLPKISNYGKITLPRSGCPPHSDGAFLFKSLLLYPIKFKLFHFAQNHVFVIRLASSLEYPCLAITYLSTRLPTIMAIARSQASPSLPNPSLLA